MDLLNEIGGLLTRVSSASLQAELAELFHATLSDSSDVIAQSATLVAQALLYQARGELTAQDVATILDKQLRVAQIEANNAQIALRQRIESQLCRLIRLSVQVLVCAL